MLLESNLAELSIDILDDQQQQMLHMITTLAASNYTHRVLLEMCSPSKAVRVFCKA